MAKKTKKKLIRVQTENSQGPWNRTPKQSKKDNIYRKQANRIVELEKKIAELSTGNDGKMVLQVRVSLAVHDVINKLTATGLWGKDREETAAQMVALCVRAERYL